MGYRSEVRTILQEKDFNELSEKMDDFCKKQYAQDADGYNIMKGLDIKHECTGYDEDGKETKYIYFGWDYIKWYDCDGLIELFEKCLYEFDEYHFVRIGEDLSDIEEHHNLTKTDVDCIQISRHFDDPFEWTPKEGSV